MFYSTENLPYLLAGTLVIGTWLAMRQLVCGLLGRHPSGIQFWLRWALGVYLTMLFALTVSPVYGCTFPRRGGSLNLVPFAVWHTLPAGILNFLGNIALFVPMGLLLYFLTGSRRRPWPVLWGTAVSCLIETLQLFNTRATDVDDILLNTLGTLLGWLAGGILSTVFSAGQGRASHGRRFSRRRARPMSLVCLSLAVVMAVGFGECHATQSTVPQAARAESAPSAPAVQLHAARASGDNSISVTATHGILFCTDTAEILWEKSSRETAAPASCTKLLNALTVLSVCSPDEVFTAGEEVNFIAADASRSYLQKGAELTVRQAMVAMLLPSGNDAAYALAAYAGRKIASDPSLGPEQAVSVFVDRMNGTAQQLGAQNSCFCTPDGYDADGQYTTAYDLALIGQAAAENKEIAEIAGMPSSRESWASGEVAEYTNTNELLLPESDCYLPDCTGLKTGTSDAAGACLVMSFTVSGAHYIGVVLGSTKEQRFADALQIYSLIPGACAAGTLYAGSLSR